MLKSKLPMVNYVCRTCLYVCDNEFSFRKLEKVKPVLELFVPEIKSCIGKYSLICEQCYYFLKNVEKFKVKCMETQNKLYSMNIETIRDNHDAVLKTVANEASVRRSITPPNGSKKRPAAKSKPRKPAKRLKKDAAVAVPATATTSESDITLASILKTSSIAGSVISAGATTISLAAQNNSKDKSESSTSYGPVANDLLQLFDYSKNISDIRNFRRFAVKQATDRNTTTEVVTTSTEVAAEQVIMNYIDEDSVEDEDDDSDEYMARKDLVAAGLLSDYSDDESPGLGKESQTESSGDIDMVEINGRIEIKAVDSNRNRGRSSSTPAKKTENQVDKCAEKDNNNDKLPSTTTATSVKTENHEDDENPGFFNKQSDDGFYKCKMCQKRYKTSKGLYNHTKDKHADQVRIFHCEHCSFFSLWKSALNSHYNTFHGYLMGKDKCTLCDFETRSKDQLDRHVLDNHVYEKFMRCSLCRARFSDSVLFAKHVEKEHLTVDMATSTHYCHECCLMLLTDEDFRNHEEQVHGKISCERCVGKTFGSKAELHEHQQSVHATSSVSL